MTQKPAKRFVNHYLRDILTIVALFAIVVAVTELMIFRVYKPNYYQRINTYFYVFFPLLSLVLFFYYYSRNIRKGMIAPTRSIRYRLMTSFLIVALLPSTPVFLLSSDTIKRGLTDYLSLDFTSIKTLHRDSLTMIYKDKLKEVALANERGGCAWLKRRWNQCFRTQQINGRYQFDNAEGRQLFNYYRSYYRRRSTSDNVEFFVYERPVQVKSDTKPQLESQVVAVLHTERPVRTLFFTPLEEKEKELFIRGENFLQNYLLVTTYQAPIQTAVDIFLALLFILVLIVSILMAYFVSKQLADPIISMAQTTELMSAGQHSETKQRLDSLSEKKGPGEVKVLAQSFKQMVEEIEKYKDEQYQIQKSEAWKEVAQRIAHEIKNPLTPMQLSAQRIIKQLDKYADEIPENYRSILQSSTRSITNQVETIRRLIDSFSKMARLPVPVKKGVSLLALVQDFIDDNYSEDITFQLRHPPGLKSAIIADSDQLKQVLLNLYHNAKASLASKKKSQPGFKGEIDITLTRKVGGLQLEFADNGLGIHENDLPNVTKANFSTKENGEGLGLAIVKKILADHNAELQIKSRYHQGATVEILFKETV